MSAQEKALAENGFFVVKMPSLQKKTRSMQKTHHHLFLSLKSVVNIKNRQFKHVECSPA